MKKRNLIVSVLLILCLITTHAFAVKKVGQSGFKFLDVSIGARPAGMGEAYTILGSGIGAAFYNPAGLARMDNKYDLSFNYTKWIAGITYSSGGVAFNMGDLGVFGLTMIAPTYPDMIGTAVANNEQGYVETGNLDVGAFAAGLAYAKQLTDKFYVGGHVKYVSQKLGSGQRTEDGSMEDNKASTVAFDFGTIFYPRFRGIESFAFGMSVLNFSQQVTFERSEFQLPLTFSLGFAVEVFDILGDTPEDMALNLEIDAIHPRDYTERLHVGAEFLFKNMIAARAGYKFNYDEEGLTFGVGFQQKFIQVDYSYTAFGVFDTVSRIGVQLSL